MKWLYDNVCVAFLVLFTLQAAAQRSYAPNSVLTNGNWYKIAVTNEGIYKVDAAFFAAAGIPLNNISSASIRLYGNPGLLPAENNALPRQDDLMENAIMLFDGGDGIFNNSDYFIFYTPGTNRWLKDSINSRFSHQKNLYSNQAFYYLTIGGNGLRVSSASNLTSNVNVSTYNARYFHETDTVNFLNSGKEWYGEEFSEIPNSTTSRNFTVTIPGLQAAQPATIISNVVNRSTGAFSRFDIKANSMLVLQQLVAFTGTNSNDPFAVADEKIGSFTIPANNLSLNYSYTPGSVNAQGWLNWFEIHTRANLSMTGIEQLFFRDWQSVGNNQVAKFTVQNTIAATQVWDVTNAARPVKMSTNFAAGNIEFTNNCAALHEYAAFSGNSFLQPTLVGKVDNQNLHNSIIADLLIVTHPSLLSQAQRLASHHIQKDNLRTITVTTEQVYNEFSSGTPSPVAIRDFVKMYYDKAAGDSAKMPKYLLLFGDASFDYKNRINGNTNMVPCFENNNSLEPLATYTSDDFFGFLNDNEDINNAGILNLLDIGIGRIPAKNREEATAFVDKIIAYSSSKSLGPWRNEITFIADDEDANLHLDDAEIISTTAKNIAPVFNQSKFYADAYKQESGSGGSRYPDANTAINNKIYAGNLIWNYNGHGNNRRLAEEVILDDDIINGWNNPEKLPLFITATCDFAPYDNPLQNSVGENLLLKPKTGAIALMTTTRLVFSSSNRDMNNSYIQAALRVKANGRYPTLGDAVLKAKNFTYQNFPDINNNRKFTLLGDPALTLNFPVNKVQTDSVNYMAVSVIPDTLKALGKYTIAGKIKDAAGNFLNTFDGTIYTTIFDKQQTVTTLANDPGSISAGFKVQNNILYKGKAKVVNGLFNFSFIVPKDINYQYGNGKISYYAEDGSKDGNGDFTNIIVGGINNNAADDKEGPKIKAWMNDEKFINGGTCNESPLLIVRLTDSAGINTSGLGIGHTITAILDNDNRQLFELNDFYEADINSYQSGKIVFQLPKLAIGWHSIKIKAWDVFNNSGECVLEFNVAKDNTLTISHVLNYPNPFTTHTTFWFEHNHPNEDLSVNIRIFTISGKLVKNIQRTINTPGNRSCDIEWDGKDDFGAKIGRGVYIYQFVVLLNHKKASIFEKMMIF